MSKKFLDLEGLSVLWRQINLNDYPNNQTLIAILNAIDTTKQDSITGNAGDFVVIGDNGKPTTQTILRAEDQLF